MSSQVCAIRHVSDDVMGPTRFRRLALLDVTIRRTTRDRVDTVAA